MVGPDLMPKAIPRPWPSGSGVPHPARSAATRATCAQSPSHGVSNGMNRSPRRATLRSRSSSGSMPSARAPSSSALSTAQLTCGLPKPRKAVDGTVCERTDRARIRTAGMLYGPAPGYEPLPTTRSAMSV